MNSRSVIIGKGEIGTALGNVLKDYNPLFLDFNIDLIVQTGEFVAKNLEVDIMHIAFTYSDKFVESVKNYQKIFKPKHTVIHSTVPVGVSRQCDALHSPIIGIHPNLESGIRTFIKFIGGENASEVADYFRRAGLKVYIVDKSEATELMKIADTTYYGLCVEYTKEIKRLCDKYQVPFEFWTIYNDNYNKGYEKLGHSEFVRPNLVPIMKKIGGHCVLPNLHFLESDFAKFLQEQNAKSYTNLPS